MTQATAAATVLLVDDHPLYRDGLKALLSRSPDLTVCGEAGTIAEARRLVAEHQPSLVILDLGLPDGGGMEFLQELRERPDPPKVLILTVRDENDPAAVDALRAGAAGFLNKQALGSKLMKVVGEVLAGRTYMNPDIIEFLLRRRP